MAIAESGVLMRRFTVLTLPLALACSSDPGARANASQAGGAGAIGEAGSSWFPVGGTGGVGGAVDAGSSETGSSEKDATSDAAEDGFYGDSRCDTAALSLCDGFETGDIDLELWSVLAPAGNTVSIDGQHVARGKLALHVSASNAANTRAHISQKKTFPASQNTFYGRAFVYMGAIPINNFNLFAADGADGDFNLGGQVQPLGDPTGTSMIRFSTHPLHTSSLSTTPVPSGEWHCWEWHFDGEGESSLRAWLDEVPLDDMTVTGGTSKGAWVAPDFDNLSFGIHHPHPEPAASYELWIDEVAVDAKRIGCKR